MSFPEGPPTGEPQRYATDGRDAEGTSPTAEPEDSTTAAQLETDPSEGTSDSGAVSTESQKNSGQSTSAADWDSGNRNTAAQEDDRGQRAAQPGGALGPGTTATGGGTSLD
jgi:hypothetical protein